MARRLFPGLTAFLVSVVLWSCWWRWGVPLLPPGPGSALIEGLAVKGALWLLPLAPALLRREREQLVPTGRLFTAPIPWLPCVGLVCASAAFLHTVRLATGNGNTVVFFQPVLILLSLSAGVVEELTFRGGYFNLQAPVLGTGWAAILNGFLFLPIHYPGLLWGLGWEELFSPRTLLIFTMGAVLSLVFARWRCLPLNMVFHTAWNILSYLFGLSG